jgi:hypothetical protein
MADESTRPTFVVSERDVPKLAAQAWDALDRRRPRTVFRRAAELLRAVRGANEPGVYCSNPLSVHHWLCQGAPLVINPQASDSTPSAPFG